MPDSRNSRQGLIRRFALKAFQNDRFTWDWFPLRPRPSYALRNREEIEESMTRTTRLKNTTINHIKKILNQETDLPKRNE